MWKLIKVWLCFLNMGIFFIIFSIWILIWFNKKFILHNFVWYLCARSKFLIIIVYFKEAQTKSVIQFFQTIHKFQNLEDSNLYPNTKKPSNTTQTQISTSARCIRCAQSIKNKQPTPTSIHYKFMKYFDVNMYILISAHAIYVHVPNITHPPRVCVYNMWGSLRWKRNQSLPSGSAAARLFQFRGYLKAFSSSDVSTLLVIVSAPDGYRFGYVLVDHNRPRQFDVHIYHRVRGCSVIEFHRGRFMWREFSVFRGCFPICQSLWCAL